MDDSSTETLFPHGINKAFLVLKSKVESVFHLLVEKLLRSWPVRCALETLEGAVSAETNRLHTFSLSCLTEPSFV